MYRDDAVIYLLQRGFTVKRDDFSDGFVVTLRGFNRTWIVVDDTLVTLGTVNNLFMRFESDYRSMLDEIMSQTHYHRYDTFSVDKYCGDCGTHIEGSTGHACNVA